MQRSKLLLSLAVIAVLLAPQVAWAAQSVETEKNRGNTQLRSQSSASNGRYIEFIDNADNVEQLYGCSSIKITPSTAEENTFDITADVDMPDEFSDISFTAYHEIDSFDNKSTNSYRGTVKNRTTDLETVPLILYADPA